MVCPLGNSFLSISSQIASESLFWWFVIPLRRNTLIFNFIHWTNNNLSYSLDIRIGFCIKGRVPFLLNGISLCAKFLRYFRVSVFRSFEIQYIISLPIYLALERFPFYRTQCVYVWVTKRVFNFKIYFWN